MIAVLFLLPIIVLVGIFANSNNEKQFKEYCRENNIKYTYKEKMRDLILMGRNK